MTPIKNAQMGQKSTRGGGRKRVVSRETDGKKLCVRLAKQLGRDIVAGRRAPGSPLPNATDMCAQFSISRTTLREAYSILIAKGLIEVRARTGTRVRSTAEWNALDPEVLAWRFEATPSRVWLEEPLALRQMVEPAAAGPRGVDRIAIGVRHYRCSVRPDEPPRNGDRGPRPRRS